MTADFLDHRLTVAPHFSVHAQDADRTLLLSEERSFRLNGRFYRDLLTRLDGSRTGRQLLELFRAQVEEWEIQRTLGTLVEQGYVVALPDRADRNVTAFWTARGEAPLDVERRLRGVRLGVLPLGSGPVTGSEGAGTLLSLLAGSGLSVTDETQSDLLLVLVDDYLQASLTEFATAAEAIGRAWIPVKPAGLHSWIGPRFGSGKPPVPHPAGLDDTRRPCFHCLARRLITHRPGDTLIAPPSQGLRPARAWTAGSLAMARGLAVAEALRQVRGEPSRLDRHLLTMDSTTGQQDAHLAPRFQDCPSCALEAQPVSAVRYAEAAEPRPIRLSTVATGGDGDGGWRALTAEQALGRLEPLVSPLTGIVSKITDHELAPGLYLSLASQANREQVDPRANRRLGKPGSAGGKGLTKVQARISCLAEAVERYASGWTGSEPRRRARYLDLAADATHPASLLGFSERQYAERASLNREGEIMHYIPEPFREDRRVEWSPAWSLTQDKARWLPTRFCYFDYRGADVPEDHPFCLGDSNGCASGGTLEEAILQGLLEVVERDAIAVWWYNRLRRPAAALETIDIGFLSAMKRHAAAEGRQLEVLDLTTDLGIPVMAAVSWKAGDGGEITIGFGAHLDATVAATRALTELNQAHYFNIANERPDETAPDGQPSFPAARRWFETATVEQHPYVVPADMPPSDLKACSIAESGSIDGAVRQLVERLDEQGHEVVVLDYDRRDLPLHCVKVVVPGLCHFWNRRGAPRLFEAPVRQGLLDQPLREDQLNPIAFYI